MPEIYKLLNGQGLPELNSAVGNEHVPGSCEAVADLTARINLNSKKIEAYGQKVFSGDGDYLEVACNDLTFAVCRCPVPASLLNTDTSVGNSPYGALLYKQTDGSSAMKNCLISMTQIGVAPADSVSSEFSFLANVALTPKYMALSFAGGQNSGTSWYIQVTEKESLDQYIVRAMCGSKDTTQNTADWATIAATCYET